MEYSSYDLEKIAELKITPLIIKQKINQNAN